MSKRIFALLLCAVMVLAFAACGSKTEEETTTAADTTVEALNTESSAETSDEADTTEETAAPEETSETEEITEVSSTEATTAETTATILATTTKATTTKKTTTTKKATTTKKVTTTAKKVTAPTSIADIVALYNDATTKASKSKPGYSKVKETSVKDLEMGALAKIKIVRTTVAEFLGEGSTNTTVKKGSFNGTDLKVSTLKASDVTKATCTPSSDGKYYDITITVKNETNTLKSSSALGKFTRDYKDADEIKAGLDEAGASLDSIVLSSSDVVIKARVTTDKNQFVSLSHSMKMPATLTNVKYTIAKVSVATATVVNNITFSNFKY